MPSGAESRTTEVLEGPTSILVVCHARDKILDGPYLVSRLIPEWEALGLRVEIGSDPGAPKEADIAILHVDLTVIPREHQVMASRCKAVINAGAADISKRRVSRQLVRPGSPSMGPVIVKTNLNYGGKPERAGLGSSLGARAWRRFMRGLPWFLTGELAPAEYPVYPSKREVPTPVWFNRRLVVEEFRPERQGDHYCLRSWVFLGDREMTVRCVGKNPVVKASDIVDVEYDVGVPDELRRLREELGFDYGKFDFGLSGGKVTLYDANRTPVVAAPGPVAREHERRNWIPDLAEGIFAWAGR
jgi:hypothetical protein